MKSLFISLALLLTAIPMSAKWEQILEYPTCYAGFKTSQGTILASDYRYPMGTGGISVSSDNGQTWTKCDVFDYNYAYFFEAEGYIYALGTGCKIAKSADYGLTWEILDYSPEAAMYYDSPAETFTYAGIYHDGAVYVGNTNAGVFKTTNQGRTWKSVDYYGLTLGAGGMAWIYRLLEYKGELFAFSAHTIFSYNDQFEVWVPGNIHTNFFTNVTVHDGKMVGGRGIVDQSRDNPFMQWSENGDDWYEVPRPEDGPADNNVRCVESIGNYLISYIQNSRIYATKDWGEHWIDIAEGLPYDQYDCLMPICGFFHDDEYVYAVVYSPSEFDTTGGLYRKALTEFPDYAGIESVDIDNNAQVKSTNFYSIDGRTIANPQPGTLSIKVERLTNGETRTSKVLN